MSKEIKLAGKQEQMELSSKARTVFEDSRFKDAVNNDDLKGAQEIALSIIEPSQIDNAAKNKMIYNIDTIRSAQDLQKYMYNSWLMYTGFGTNASLEELIKLADSLDQKGLTQEADMLDGIIGEDLPGQQWYVLQALGSRGTPETKELGVYDTEGEAINVAQGVVRQAFPDVPDAANVMTYHSDKLGKEVKTLGEDELSIYIVRGTKYPYEEVVVR